MATRAPYTVLEENRHLHQKNKKMQNNGPKPSRDSAVMENLNITKSTNGMSTGDVVSDDSSGEEGDEEGDHSAPYADEAHDEDSDEQGGHIQLGAARVKRSSGSPVIGTANDGNGNFIGGQAAAGAEQADTSTSDNGEDDEDDEYDDVDGISDSEDEMDATESSVLELAAGDLRREFERLEEPSSARVVTSGMDKINLIENPSFAEHPTLRNDDTQRSDPDYDLDFSQDPFAGLSQQDELYQELLADAHDVFYVDNELSSWRAPDTPLDADGNGSSAHTQKKVRFEETASSRSSSLSSDDDPRETFPDLFADCDSLAARQQALPAGGSFNISHDNDESEFEFDGGDDDENFAFQGAAEMTDSDTDMSDESYEGETTDDDDPEEQLARWRALKENQTKTMPPPKAPIGAPTTPSAKQTTPRISRASANRGCYSTPRNFIPPKTGTFRHDPTRASVTPDVRGSGVKVTCPTKPPAEDRAYWDRARQVVGNSDGSPRNSISWTRSTPQAASIPKRPFTARSTLGTMFDGNLDFLRNNDKNGIVPKEFLRPSRKNSMQSSVTSNTLTEDAASEYDSNINIEDFVHKMDSDSEMEEPSSAVIVSPSQQDFLECALLQSSPVVQRDASNGLLDHLEQQPGLVGSFRNNQHNARHFSSLAANPAKRAQTSEANALQKGRRNAANTPITPARKKRASQDFGLTGAGVKKVSSPLAQKNQRRSRGDSLSGVHQTLAVDRFAGYGK